MDKDIRTHLANTLLYRYINRTHRDEFFESWEPISFPEGSYIVTEGDESDHVFMVLDGQVSVSVKEPDDTEVYISTIGAGEIFGEAGIFLKTARTANIVSQGDTRVLRIHRDKLLSFIKKDPSTGVKVMMIIVFGLLKKLRENNQELAYERLGDSGQEDIDALVESMLVD